jgi:hypothetical protein
MAHLAAVQHVGQQPHQPRTIERSLGFEPSW